MTTNKGVNRTFLITAVIYIGSSLLFSFSGISADLPFYLNIFISQMLVFLPAFFYIKIAGMKVGELIPYRKIRLPDALLAIVMTYLFYPLLVVANLLTMFFVKNTSAELAGNLQDQNTFLNMIFVALLPAFVEEFVFRGMIYQTYKKSSMRIGILLSAFLFGCMHLNFNQFLYTFLFGIILAMTVEATGSILTSMICHFVLNLNSVLMSALLDKSSGSFDSAMEESSALLDDPRLLLAGTAVWMVIAVFTTAGGIGIWIYLARKNGRLEMLREGLKEPAKEKIITVSLIGGMIFLIGVMILLEVLNRITVP